MIHVGGIKDKVMLHLRLDKMLVQAVENFRKGRRVQSHEMNKTEAISELIRLGLHQIDIADRIENGYRPDMRIILDKLSFQESLNLEEIKFIFAYLNGIIWRIEKLGVPKSLIFLMYEIAIAFSLGKDRIELEPHLGLSYFIGNSSIDGAKNLSDLLRKQVEQFRNKYAGTEIVSFHGLEMSLRNAFVVIRDYDVGDVTEINRIINQGDNAYKLSSALKFYKSIFYKTIKLRYDLKSTKYQYDKVKIDGVMIDANLMDDFSALILLNSDTGFTVNSFTEYQLTKLGLLGHDVSGTNCKPISYEHSKLNISGKFFKFSDENEVKKIFNLFKQLEDKNKERFNTYINTYGALI